MLQTRKDKIKDPCHGNDQYIRHMLQTNNENLIQDHVLSKGAAPCALHEDVEQKGPANHCEIRTCALLLKAR